MTRGFIAIALIALGGQLGGIAAAHAEGLARWQGLWSGTCRLSPPSRGIAQFRASLEIRQRDTRGLRYSWILTYHRSGGRPPQVRNYEMIAVNQGRGHWMIDEKNGLKLDAYKVANQIFTPFTFKRVLITGKYVLLNQGILLELPTFHIQSGRTTCLRAQPRTCARSYPLQSLQLCLLRRNG